jgi:hypothetical protein
VEGKSLEKEGQKGQSMKKGVTFDKCRFVHLVISADIRKTCSGFELVVGRRAEGHGIVSRINLLSGNYRRIVKRAELILVGHGA